MSDITVPGRKLTCRGRSDSSIRTSSRPRATRKSAIKPATPAPGLILPSDRASQYASTGYRRLIDAYGWVQSMSRKGDCWDNAPMESFFKTLKVERVHQLRYDTRAEARLDLVDW